MSYQELKAAREAHIYACIREQKLQATIDSCAAGAITCAESAIMEALSQNDQALGLHAYTMSESHLGGYRLIVGFDTLDQVQAAHSALVAAGKRATRTSEVQRGD